MQKVSFQYHPHGTKSYFCSAHTAMASTLPFVVMTGKSTEVGEVDVDLACKVSVIFYFFDVIKTEVVRSVS